MNKSIGGFIPWESGHYHGNPYHFSSNKLSSARAALRYVISFFGIRRIYLPCYICSEIINLLKVLNLDYIFYDIDESFYPKDLPILNNNEYFLYINYFGVCRSNVFKLKKIFNKRLIVDLSMAFFERNYNLLSFNSCRKFFGTPDGAYLFGIDIPTELIYNPSLSTRHLFLSNTNQELAYSLFKSNEGCISTEIYKMSSFTQSVMRSIDYPGVINSRIKNFNYLNDSLKCSNLLKFNYLSDEVPLYYPYLTNSNIDRDLLQKYKVYTPRLWDNLNIQDKDCFSLFLVNRLIPLPIDQRYNTNDMDFILNIIKKNICCNS